MPKSAGLLLYRIADGELQVLLAHPGGPYFSKKDEGSWTVPKGLVEDDEPELRAAVREFEEETSVAIETDIFIDLGRIRQKGGKIVHAWACQGDVDPNRIESNTFELEWPPRSGRLQQFPEIDRVAWFALGEASQKIMAAQRPFLDRLREQLGDDPPIAP